MENPFDYIADWFQHQNTFSTDPLYDIDTRDFSSGFDAEHPVPSYGELIDMGFDSNDALTIVHRDPLHHRVPYSDRELFKVLYESDNPVQEYKEMIQSKYDDMDEEFREFKKEFIEQYPDLNVDENRYFDWRHPLPTERELMNLGFKDYEAREIWNYGHYGLSQSEVFNIIYNSEDPVEAFRSLHPHKLRVK